MMPPAIARARACWPPRRVRRWSAWILTLRAVSAPVEACSPAGDLGKQRDRGRVDYVSSLAHLRELGGQVERHQLGSRPEVGRGADLARDHVGAAGGAGP